MSDPTPRAADLGLVQLVPGGDWVERFGPPCPCGATLFAVERARLVVRQKGQPDFVREVVRSRCPACTLLTDRYAKRRERIGTHDIVAGTVTLDPTS